MDILNFNKNNLKVFTINNKKNIKYEYVCVKENSLSSLIVCYV